MAVFNPYRTVKEWFSLVKQNGLLIITVPDEDLYEQGVFPSRYNNDHKWTFTINKSDSWCNYSINLSDIAKIIGGKIVLMEKQDIDYDYSKKDIDQTLGNAMAQNILIIRKL